MYSGNVTHVPALPLSHVWRSLVSRSAAVLSSQDSRQRAGLAVDMQPVGRGGGSAVFVSGDSGKWTAEISNPGRKKHAYRLFAKILVTEIQDKHGKAPQAACGAGVPQDHPPPFIKKPRCMTGGGPVDTAVKSQCPLLS